MAKAKKAESLPGERNRGGRPSKWEDRFVHMAAKATAAGMTHIEIAEMLQVSEPTFRRWLVDRPEMRVAMSMSLEAADTRVGQSLLQLALGYTREEEEIKVIEGEVVRVPVKRHYPASPGVVLQWADRRFGWWSGADPAVPKDDGQEVEGTNLSIRDVARRVALLMHMGAKGTTQ